jgi:hypothetical protein
MPKLGGKELNATSHVLLDRMLSEAEPLSRLSLGQSLDAAQPENLADLGRHGDDRSVDAAQFLLTHGVLFRRRDIVHDLQSGQPRRVDRQSFRR